MVLVCQEEEESTWVPGKLKREVGFELHLEGFKNENIGADASQELYKNETPRDSIQYFSNISLHQNV